MPAPLSPKSNLTPAEFVRIEARALLEAALRLESTSAASFEAIVIAILEAVSRSAKVILLGVGKSGLIARKIAATLRSTGTAAHFLHPAEALHGDLGMIAPGDILIALSLSGETDELLSLLPAFARFGNLLISFCGAPASTLAVASAIVLDTSVSKEACGLNLAPTASTTVMLALGDALALEVSQRRGFAPQGFADLHPGGRLGHRLARVRDLMHTGSALPAVSPSTTLPDIIHEMSSKKLGMTAVVAEDVGGNATASAHACLRGIISDGDLRRLLERDGAHALARTAAEIMNPAPLTIGPDAFASEALALMEARKITALIVTSSTGEALGAIHLHDLWTR